MPSFRRAQHRSKKSLAKKVATVTRSVNKIRGVIETKHKDTYAASTSVSTVPGVVMLNDIGQGDDVVNRSGNYAVWKSVSMRIIGEAGDSYNYLRCMVVWDKQPTGVALTAAELFQDNIGSDVLSPVNWDNRRRFKIVMDKTIKLDTYAESGRSPYIFNKTIKLPSTVGKTYYSGSAGLIANIKTGVLYFIYLSDSGATTHPTFRYYIRSTFQDA